MTRKSETTPEKRRSDVDRRREEEAAWAAKCGPVVTYFDPSRIEKREEPPGEEGDGT